MKRRVYFNEFNILMGTSTYLPLVSGLLRAHAENSPIVQDVYTFAPYLFHLGPLDDVLKQYNAPAVAAFSLSMWNEQLSLRVAKAVKERFPECLIVFGGAQVPHDARCYMSEHDFVDIAVRGEGEESFTDILERFADGGSYEGIPGTTWRTEDGELRLNPEERPFNRDLDVYPSPYLNGLYDDLMATRQDLTFQAIIETNRGCPFKCTFCYWGKGGLSRKYRYHSLERVKAEIEWMGQRGIRYVFNADSNFGMHRRDMEIAEFLVETKKRYGAPEKFRTCYGKNTDEKIYAIGNLFRANDMEKGITISYQSYDDIVQTNIKRDNIKLSSAEELQRKFNEQDIPIYTELILGLPGETPASWFNGVDRILESGLKNQLFIYICQVFPNTELGDPAYQKRFGVRTRRIEINEIHARLRDPSWVPEYEDIVIQTDSMTTEEWRRMLIFSWVTMLFHSLKVGFFLCGYLHRRHGIAYSDFLSHIADGRFCQSACPILTRETEIFAGKTEALLAGHGRGCEFPEYGNIYWDEEEASFLRIAEDFDAFYIELGSVTKRFLAACGISFDERELDEVLRYQAMRMPRQRPPQIADWTFAFNVPEYFETFFDTTPVRLQLKPQRLTTEPKDFGDDSEAFARESILWARKSGTMLTSATIDDPVSALAEA